MNIEDMNYYNDSRVRLRAPGWASWRLDEAAMVAMVARAAPADCEACEDERAGDNGLCEDHGGAWSADQEDDHEEGEREGNRRVPRPWEVEVPFRWEVCPTCQGSGCHVNPSIDAGGITREDFDEDPDFAHDYMSGRYDVQCSECRGKRVVPELEPRTAEQRAAVQGIVERERREAAIEREERRNLAYGY